ncbi:lamin tail domain-containing protein [Candidatus Sumerlaeota bacterium]|nr:lamin tail domain-containing protein [Candidatus Sumerlaeota bacterium]
MKKVLLAGSIIAAAMSANAAVVINEYLYDPDTGTDAGEFVELYNNGGAAVDISAWTLQHINGSNGAITFTATVPAATTLNAGDYYVIGNAAVLDAAYGVGTVDLNFTMDNLVQNDNEGFILRDSASVIQDTATYERDRVFSALLEGPNAVIEGGIGQTRSRQVLIGNIGTQVSAGRLPNGSDSGSNEADFAAIHCTPGAANTDSITLPFTDDFSTVNAAWKYGFVPVRVVDPTAPDKPGSFSPDGGNVLEVGDATGGGDANFIPAALSLVNVEGYIFIPPDNVAPWSIGIGVAERSNLNWFSPTIGNGMENGFYLEYQNGPVTGGKASIPAIVGPGGEARLIAVNSTPTANTGASTAAVGTVLGSTTAVSKGAWNAFRLCHDQAGNRLYASINGVTFYDGVIPAGSNVSGGVYVGFCERHTGVPVPASAEFLYLDGLSINTTLPNANVDNWTIIED